MGGLSRQELVAKFPLVPIQDSCLIGCVETRRWYCQVGCLCHPAQDDNRSTILDRAWFMPGFKGTVSKDASQMPDKQDPNTGREKDICLCLHPSYCC